MSRWAVSGRRIRFVLSKDRYVIGFEEGCDLNLGARRWPWGRRALEVVKLPSGGYKVARLSDWVGVKINGDKLVGEHTLRDKDIVKVASTAIRYLGRTKLAGPLPGDRGGRKPVKKDANLATLGPSVRRRGR
jgi:hypothetical protein